MDSVVDADSAANAVVSYIMSSAGSSAVAAHSQRPSTSAANMRHTRTQSRMAEVSSDDDAGKTAVKVGTCCYSLALAITRRSN